MTGIQDPKLTLDERLRLLYPMVNEAETPLPRCWSTKDKFNYIGLFKNNLRVRYEGHGKTHKDASSVRATHPIPATCGIYYFEVKIASKGRDGYMGVGLAAQGVNMNRLPGWDKHSYGYHGDDGHSFCSSGTGQAYGPTFTTGDVIGCGLNLVTGSCFYTKNGHNLGVAFTDLPPGLYPTVGLQTPGEVVDANFGQEPFVFDIEGEMLELKATVRSEVERFQTLGKHGEWQQLLHRMVSTYLVHYGYSSTAEVFNRSTGQTAEEDMESIRNRQLIRKLVLDGKMSEAIRRTNELYPVLLEENENLKFLLRVRQFIETVVGVDTVEEGDLNTNGQQMTNGGAESNSTAETSNGNSGSKEASVDDESMEVDHNHTSSTIANDPHKFEKLVAFGQSLQLMHNDMQQRGKSEINAKLLTDAFALLCYTDPHKSPVGWQLDQREREAVSNALNSAILESKKLQAHPPLEVAILHSKQLLRLMARSDLGACAFANIDDFLR